MWSYRQACIHPGRGRSDARRGAARRPAAVHHQVGAIGGHRVKTGGAHVAPRCREESRGSHARSRAPAGEASSSTCGNSFGPCALLRGPGIPDHHHLRLQEARSSIFHLGNGAALTNGRAGGAPNCAADGRVRGRFEPGRGGGRVPAGRALPLFKRALAWGALSSQAASEVPAPRAAIQQGRQPQAGAERRG